MACPMLPPQDIATLSRLLDEALALSPAERPGWLRGLPPELGRFVMPLHVMLAREAGLDSDPRLAALPRLGDAHHSGEALVNAGDLVGPWRLLREIGRGGMGSVWLAERADGHFERQVALKLPHISWDPTLARRMTREREIDARLEHPHIARLYDAGLDGQGRPYLAFQYVDGQPIDDWCRSRSLDVEARLRLFLQVVRAVAYAHGRLVVHRDIKPANVLVSADGRAHLLDFGIAKLVHEASSEATVTLAGRAMTPGYASPEQLAGEPVTVQTDIYSLGVLLYELLTGRRPHAHAHSVADLLLALQDEPPTASRHAPDRASRRALRGSLDAVMAQCLQADPNCRYASADALAADIDRHLQGRSVSARREPAWRRLLRQLARQWAFWTPALALLLGLGVAIGMAAVSARRAAHEAERAQRVTAFVGEMFQLGLRDPDPAQASVGSDAFVSDAAALIRQRFPGQPGLQADLFGGVARALMDMGASLPAVDYASQHLNNLEAAEAPREQVAQGRLLMGEALMEAGRLREARQAAQAVLGVEGMPTTLRSRARLLLAALAFEASVYAQAEAELDQADAELARGSMDNALATRAALQRAGLLARTNRIDASRVAYAKATKLATAEPTPSLLGRVQTRQALDLQKFTFDIAESKRLHALGVAALRQAGGADAVAAEIAEARAIYLYYANGDLKYGLAEAGFATALEHLDRMRSRIPASARAKVLALHGCMAQASGRVAQGYRELSDSMAVLRRDAPESRLDLCLGFAAMQTGRADEADHILATHAALDRTLPPEGTLMNSLIYIALAENRMMQRQPEAALEALALAPAYPQEQGLSGEQAIWDRQSLAVAQARLALDAGRFTEALHQLDGISDKSFALHDSGLIRGAALCGLGYPAALALMDAGLARWQQERDSDVSHPVLAYWRLESASCALLAGQHGRAAELVQQAKAALTSQPDVAPYYKQPLQKLVAALQRH